MTLLLLIYTIAIHYGLYRLHRAYRLLAIRQAAHESLTLIIAQLANRTTREEVRHDECH